MLKPIDVLAEKRFLGAARKMEAEAIAILCDELLHEIQVATAESGLQASFGTVERPMDTTSVYLARRFCTNCCREWGDMEILLDLRARRTGKTRGEVMLELDGIGAVKYGLCCRKALFPIQRNIDNYTAHAASAISSHLGAGIPTCLALMFARPRPRNFWITETEGALPLRGPITEEAVNAMFA